MNWSLGIHISGGVLMALAILSGVRPNSAVAADPPAVVGSPKDFDALLQKHVRGDYFDYAGLLKNKEDLARFDAFLSWQATAQLSAMSRPEQIAFYINAYNACCIKAVLDHYPIHSPKDIVGFFDGLKSNVAGEDLTISQIEYDRLIANYRDMRAHFAVVCADRGCLPLRKGAYSGANLDQALDEAAAKFVKDPRHFKLDPKTGEIQISKIFEWYGEKFVKDPKRPAERPEQYLKYWADDDVRKLLESNQYKLKMIEWDWTLNEKLDQKPPPSSAPDPSGK